MKFMNRILSLCMYTKLSKLCFYSIVFLLHCSEQCKNSDWFFFAVHALISLKTYLESLLHTYTDMHISPPYAEEILIGNATKTVVVRKMHAIDLLWTRNEARRKVKKTKCLRVCRCMWEFASHENIKSVN